MAHKKSGGSTTNNRDSQPKMRGFKKFGGEHVISGNIILRQVGTTFAVGKGVKMGRDFTIYAVQEGVVTFSYVNKKKQMISVVSKN
ncbi:MAG: 50S ribosomal protein L27 [Bacteriovoracaceae bacterium]|nr:50S ribosomal protein L27 [Bacteriovoracaceae bacterium]